MFRSVRITQEFAVTVLSECLACRETRERIVRTCNSNIALFQAGEVHEDDTLWNLRVFLKVDVPHSELNTHMHTQ